MNEAGRINRDLNYSRESVARCRLSYGIKQSSRRVIKGVIRNGSNNIGAEECEQRRLMIMPLPEVKEVIFEFVKFCDYQTVI